MEPRVIWQRNDGLTRIILFEEENGDPWLDVESYYTDLLGHESWRIARSEDANLALKTLALEALGKPIQQMSGLAGQIVRYKI